MESYGPSCSSKLFSFLVMSKKGFKMLYLTSAFTSSTESEGNLEKTYFSIVSGRGKKDSMWSRHIGL